MKIIIVGAGRTGRALIKALSEKNYDITVVEKQKSILDAVTDKYNVNGVVGSGASKETLHKAGADTADILIALTPVDEVNLLSCMQAKSVGTIKTVARVFQPDFAEDRESLETEQNIDYIYNPKFDVAEEAANSIGLPGVVKPEGIFADQMQMVSVTVTAGSPIEGKSLLEIKQGMKFPILICTVLREGKLIIPDGSFTVRKSDIIGLAASRENIIEVLKNFGIAKTGAKRIMIVGGSVTTEYLTEILLKEKKEITIIEHDIEKCRRLMEKYPSVNVSYGNGEMADILEAENIGGMDAIVSLTDSDEKNMVTSMYAWSRNVPSILTGVNAPEHLKLLHRVNLDITLSASEISVNKLIRFIMNCEVGAEQNEIEKYSTVADNKAEVLQFSACGNFRKLNVKFKEPEFRLKKNTIIVSIVRNGNLIIPDGNSSIEAGDRVILVAESKHKIVRLNDILSD
ncbi:MAG: Trk system potassium transporter TrkA [Lachnospiraceae bacterium]|nr:Trk system potassium transporter TrkA [Lachnospiraceae bacterium]